MSYAYDTIADIIRLAEENNISFGDVVLRYELENYDRNEEAVIREIEHRLDIFEMSIQDGIAYTDKTASGMSGGQAAQLDGQSPRFMSEIAYKAMPMLLLSTRQMQNVPHRCLSNSGVLWCYAWCGESRG